MYFPSGESSSGVPSWSVSVGVLFGSVGSASLYDCSISSLHPSWSVSGFIVMLVFCVSFCVSLSVTVSVMLYVPGCVYLIVVVFPYFVIPFCVVHV